MDYVIIYGDRINSLMVKSFASPAKQGRLAFMEIMLDAMAAFCRLKSVTELYKVVYFRGESLILDFLMKCFVI